MIHSLVPANLLYRLTKVYMRLKFQSEDDILSVCQNRVLIYNYGTKIELEDSNETMEEIKKIAKYKPLRGFQPTN